MTERSHAPAAAAPPPADSRPPARVPDWQRLSPLMLIVHPFRELLRAIPLLAGLLIAGHSNGSGSLWGFGATGLLVASGIARYFTTTFRITDTQVQLRKGILRRQQLATPLDRVRTVDITSHLLHRMLGLARVTVGTGRSDKQKESLVLDALTRPQAQQLRDDLLHHRAVPVDPATNSTDRQSAPAATPPAAARAGELVLARFDPRWIRFGAFTMSGILTGLALGGFAANLVNEAHLHPGRSGPLRSVYRHVHDAAAPVLVLEGLAAVVIVVAMLSTSAYILSFWGFLLVRRPEGTLHVTRGLATTRATTIEERRLRGIEVSEPLPLRALHGARCIAVATGLRVDRGAERGGSMVLPPAPAAVAVRVASAIVGAAEPITCPLVRHQPAALRRRFVRALVPAIAVAAGFGSWWLAGPLPGSLAAMSLLAVPVALLLAVDRFRSLGHALVGGMLVTRFGSVVRQRIALTGEGIIGWNIRQSYFQRRAGLARLTATTAAGRQSYAVVDIAADEAVALADDTTPGLLEPFLQR